MPPYHLSLSSLSITAQDKAGLLQLRSQRTNLIQQPRILTSRILEDLIPEMINLESSLGRRVSLCRLDTTNLHLEEEFRDFNRETPIDTAYPGLRGEVDVERVLEEL